MRPYVARAGLRNSPWSFDAKSVAQAGDLHDCKVE